MKAYNGNMENGYNKFKKSINNSHAFRKANNTLSQINSFALPALTAATYINPALTPITATIGSALRTSQNIAGALRNTRL